MFSAPLAFKPSDTLEGVVFVMRSQHGRHGAPEPDPSSVVGACVVTAIGAPERDDVTVTSEP